MSAPEERSPDGDRPQIDVLLVEDALDVQGTMAQILGKAGYTVHATTDGDGALEQIALHRYRAIICDLAMPVMNGIQFFRQLEAQDPSLARRICFVTGGGTSQEATKFLERTVQPVLMKPYTIKDLVLVVAKLVDRPPTILPW
jgi:CheY-like chemotaxis protein